MVTFGCKTISVCLETQETPRVIIPLADTAGSSASRYTLYQGLNVKMHVS